MIRAFLGLPGSGKTYSMVDEAVEFFRKNQPQVYSNMSGLRCPEAIYIDGLEDLVHVSNGLVLLDEAGVMLSSRFWQGVSKDLLQRFAQVRKDGLDLWWTAQHEARVDTVLKEITNEYVRCEKYGKMVSKRRELPEDKKAKLGTRFTSLKQSTFNLYDTFEVISSDGGSAGRGAAVTLSAVARRRNAEHDRKKATTEKQTRPCLFYENVLTGAFSARVDVKEAYSYLLDNGWLQQADLPHELQWAEKVTWQQQVLRELKRRAWLKQWGLKPDDAPHFCTPDQPWLVGFSPAQVRQRRLENDLADAEEDAAELRAKARKSESGRNRPARSHTGLTIVRPPAFEGIG